MNTSILIAILACFIFLLGVLLVLKYSHAKMLQRKLEYIEDETIELSARYKDSYFRPVCKKKSDATKS